jgi:protein-S-isoprenylcysteine O-methyltransferase Ste14
MSLNNNNQNSALIPVAVILMIAVILFLNIVLPALPFRWMMVIIIAVIGIAGALVMLWMKRRGGGRGE